VELALNLDGADHVRFTHPTNQWLLQAIIPPLEYEPHLVTLFGEVQLINIYGDDGASGTANRRIRLSGAVDGRGYAGAYGHVIRYIRGLSRWVYLGGS
jgi:hypothetical protein